MFRSEIACPACGGSRLRPEPRAVRIGPLSIDGLGRQPVDEAIAALDALKLGDQDATIADPLVAEIRKRLAFLGEVGLGYLTLDRRCDTLSGGELQRVRLAAGIGSGLVGALYLLDEPSIGLHPRDADRLIAALRRLQSLGNSVLVVEHDEAFMRQADYLIDIGPGAGPDGGHVVASGRPEQVAAIPTSPTGRFLCGADAIEPPAKPRPVNSTATLRLIGATTHNLRGVDLELPLGRLISITGVSGSGKSSLIVETLAPALARRLNHAAARPGPFERLEGSDAVARLVRVDQAPIGRTPRSNAATFTGVFDDVRKVFAKTKVARQRGFAASRFSFNTKGGRCAACEGYGEKKIEMNFLPDVYVECNVCRGRRFDAQTLTARYKQKSIADVLDMPVAEAHEFFANHPTIHRMLSALLDVGLGYLPLGQPSTTISGGEAQRIKLAAELGRARSEHTLFILDEPTTGLHALDVKRLLSVLQQLVDAGNTVVVIEHHLEVIRSSDWIIDLGPEGGSSGGTIVTVGSPQQVAAHPTSHTGRFLAKRPLG